MVELVNHAELNLWGFDIPVRLLSAEQAIYLESLPKVRPPVSWVWHEMDRVWSQIESDFIDGEGREAVLGRYYSHPVWILNGVFTATDPESVGHRRAIADFAATCTPDVIIDYGGGFGELARAMSSRLPNSTIHIVEPYPSSIGRAAVEAVENIRYSPALDRACDLLIAQDVLEHVEDPIDLAVRMATVTRAGGHLVFANCFWPVIRCHLPETYYLRYTFRFVMRGLGLEFVGIVPGAPHAEIYRRPEILRPGRCQFRNRVSKVVGGAISRIEDGLRQLLKGLRKG